MRSRLVGVAWLALWGGGCAVGMPGFGGDAGDARAPTEAGARCTRSADCDDHTPCTTDRCLIEGTCEHQPDNTMCTAPMVCTSGVGCALPGARTCRASTECDDGVACTRDTCLVEGVCRNQAQDTLCPVGQSCDAVRGCQTAATRCMSAADCDDHVACTLDTCGVDGQCGHVPQNARCPAGMTCNASMGCGVTRACSTNAECDDHVYCNGAETCATELGCQAGTAPNCADTDPCTRDACDETTRMCTHAMEPSCMGSTIRSGIYDVTPRITYSCTDMIVGMTVVDLMVGAFQLSVTASGLTVTGAPATMTGPAPTGMSFTATGVVAGDCRETYQLTGTFSDATHFSGTFTASYAGVTCSLTDCANQSWPVSGTARAM